MSDSSTENLLTDLEASAERLSSANGDGKVVWHKWGAGPALVLFHGGFGSWNHWCRNIAALSSDFTVIVPDLPGLGESDPIDGKKVGVGEIAGVLIGGLDEILPKGADMQIGCFSFGAIAGSEIAAHYAERVTSFTLVGAAGFGPRERPTDGMIRITDAMTEEEKHAAARINLEILMIADPAKVNDLAIEIQLTNTSRARFRSRPLSLSDTVLKNLPRITARRNAIWGSADVTAAGTLDQRNAAIRAADPSGEIVVLDGVGHWVQYEAAEAFNAAYLKMLKREI